MNWISRLSLPFLALILGSYGAIRLQGDQGASDGYLTAGAALILVGVYVTLEVQARSRDDKDK